MTCPKCDDPKETSYFTLVTLNLGELDARLEQAKAEGAVEALEEACRYTIGQSYLNTRTFLDAARARLQQAKGRCGGG